MPSNFCPVTQSRNDHLDWMDSQEEAETERARCKCGRFFSRDAAPQAPYKVKTRCPECEGIFGRSDL